MYGKGSCGIMRTRTDYEKYKESIRRIWTRRMECESFIRKI